MRIAFRLKFLHQKKAFELPAVIGEGRVQLQRYLAREEVRQIANLKAWLIVFVGTQLKHLEEVAPDESRPL